VELLRHRFGWEGSVVADRGMISAATIAAFQAERIYYVLGARERSGKDVPRECCTMTGQPIPRQKGNTESALARPVSTGQPQFARHYQTDTDGHGSRPVF